MKTFSFLAAFFATAFSSTAALTLEDISPHFPINAQIVWQAPTNHLPKSFWIYKRLPPHPFSALVISNAMILASLQTNGIPKPSTNDFYIWSDGNACGMRFSVFSITPASATISFSPGQDHSTSNVPHDDVLVKRAWVYANQFGVDSKQVELQEMTTQFNQDENGNDLADQICGRGVFLSRLLDGISFSNYGDNGGNGGFWIEFGSNGKIRAFSLVWPDLRRDALQPTASPQEIIACIRAFKTLMLPNHQETDYFQRLKSFANVKKLTVTKITPYYMEGFYGTTPTNITPPQIIAPFAELKAVADFGNSNATVKLLAPILSSEISRLSKASVQPEQMR